MGEPLKVLLVGVSTRPTVDSAVAAGYEVVSLDYFADSDLPESVRAYSLVRDFGLAPTLANLARTTRQLVSQVQAAVFCAGVENSPALLASVPPEMIRGNPASAIGPARHPTRLAAALQGLDLSLPETLRPGQEAAWRPEIGMSWLRKDLHHSGGQGVKDWDGSPLAGGEVLQARVNGQLGSATFLADGKRAILIGLTFQYSGVPELGAENYAWCGNVAPWEDPRLAHSLARAAAALTATFGLVGINGLDFIQAEERLYLIEVNPRWPGSADLLEQVSGLNLFQLHLEACAGSLPPPKPPASTPLTFGKGILYAHRDAAMPDTHSWRASGLRDIPRPGEFIPHGAPVCSILASAADAPSCWQEILRRAGKLRGEIWPAP